MATGRRHRARCSDHRSGGDAVSDPCGIRVPGDECLLTGEDLARWTEGEVGQIYRFITAARYLTLGGECAIALGVAVAWSAPTTKLDQPVVRVSWGAEQVCGKLLTMGDGTLRVGQRKQYYIVPLISVVRVDVVPACDA